MVGFGVLPGLLIFLGAGTLNWWQAWAVLFFSLVTGILSRVALLFKNPDLAVARTRLLSDQEGKEWDRRIVPLVAVYLPMLVYLVAGLDRRIWASPTLPLWLTLLGFIFHIAGYLFGTWAMLVNPFFSAVVNIQPERGQKVVNQGPYRFLRHPAYSGGLLAWIGTPLALGALWALVPSAIIILLLIFRTALEDQALQRELPGYAAYAQKTRSRLIPWIW